MIPACIVLMYTMKIVSALQTALCLNITPVSCHSLKLSNEELDRLKADSVFWHVMWINAGTAKTGKLQHTILSCKAKYKIGIKF